MQDVTVTVKGKFDFETEFSVDEDADDQDIGEMIEKQLKRNPGLPQGLELHIDDVEIT